MAKTTRTLLSFALTGAAFVLTVRRAARDEGGQLDSLKPTGVAAPRQGVPNADRALAAKAAKTGIGREAASPSAIPAKGWWQITKRTAMQFTQNELMSEAASVTFFVLLSIFPALAALVSIYGLFSDPVTIEKQVEALSGFLPEGGLEILRDQVHRLVQTPSTGLGLGVVIGLLAALWSANQGSKAMFSALNDVYGEREKRSFVRVTATSLAFTIGGLSFLLLAIGAIALLPIVAKLAGFDQGVQLATQVLRWPLMIGVITLGLAALYRFGPSRRQAKWRWVTWGGAIAAIGWVALSFAFSWYVTSFGSYNKTYGSLGAIIGFMTWIWLSSTVLLLGAQINAEMETQTARDSTIGRDRPMGRRGAAAADSVS